MQMSDSALLAMAMLGGAALGMAFFGGLWWTVLRGAGSPRAGLWFSVSFLLRTTIVVGGFYLAGVGHWPRLVACLAGFLAARLMILRLSRLALPVAASAP